MENKFDDDVENCLRILINGGVILYPTDTIWGLGCDATNETAVSKIFEIKKRAAAKSLIVLIANEKDILHYTSCKNVPEPFPDMGKPTTIIYPGAKSLATNTIAEDGSIGIRIVKEVFCKKLIVAFGKPIISTSANTSGAASPENFNTIEEEIKSSVDYIVSYRQEEKQKSIPSAILKLNSDGSFKTIRS